MKMTDEAKKRKAKWEQEKVNRELGRMYNRAMIYYLVAKGLVERKGTECCWTVEGKAFVKGHKKVAKRLEEILSWGPMPHAK